MWTCHTILVERAIAVTTVQQEAQSMVWLAEFKSVITVQRTLRCVYGGDSPHARDGEKIPELLFRNCSEIGTVP